jgi:hypothetical protein
MQAVTKIGRTGFNSYSINLDYRTGCHVDKKNVAGSLSALVILETGEPYQGGLYMLPQFRLGLAVKQGTVVFHRSDHKEKGFASAACIASCTVRLHCISCTSFGCAFPMAMHSYACSPCIIT